MAGHTESTAKVIPIQIAKQALVPYYNWFSFGLSAIRIIIRQEMKAD